MLNHQMVRFISITGFFFGFTDAFFIYILSSYFSEVIGSNNVGGFYLVAFCLVLGALWFLHRLIWRIGGSTRAFFLFVLAAVVFSAILTLLPVGWVGAAALIGLLIVSNIAWVVLDVILEEYSSDTVTGRVRGLHLTIINAGIMLAPLLSTNVVSTYGFGGIFFGMTLGYAVLFAIAILFLRNGKMYASAKMEARDAIKKMLHNKNLANIYSVSLALELFYIVMVVYSPIYLRSIGISWEHIGLLFMVMLLPFVLLQYPIGLLADKRFGEKEFLIASLAIGAVSVFFFGFTSSSDLLLLGTILFFTRVGAAGIEVLRDTYFYKQIDGRDDDLIAFFRTARPMANIFAAVLAIPFLAIFPLQEIFFLVALVLTIAVIPALLLDDTPGENTRVTSQ